MKNAESKTNEAWKSLFEKYDISKNIDEHGFYKISAAEIKEFREPRLMAKFDHSINLPSVLSKENLSILPDSRGTYVIARFNAYHNFEQASELITQVSKPNYIKSIDYDDITSETIALNAANSAGILAEFLGDEDIIPTVSGRMGSGNFMFEIGDKKSKTNIPIEVENSQIEIDGAYEGHKTLCLVEAKNNISDDFLIRQLYYPYRTWKQRIDKDIKTVFFVYSNGIYRLYEYEFKDKNIYDSIHLVKQKNYSLENVKISIEMVQELLRTITLSPEPEVPFPQADKFDRVINLCEQLVDNPLTHDSITQDQAFDSRQTGYYTNAARYLGLLDDDHSLGENGYKLTSVGKGIFDLPYKERQMKLITLILEHKPFSESLNMYFQHNRTMPTRDNIVAIMKNSHIYNVNSEDTYERRAQTIKSWLNWIIDITNQKVSN